jgi:hypothetical protein
MTLLRALPFLLLLAGCDARNVPVAGGRPSAVLKGRKLDLGVLLTEKERQEAPERCAPLTDGHAWLISWPRPRFFKLESERARASFDVAFLGADGAVLETQLLQQAHPEGLVPSSEAAHALLLPLGQLKKLDAQKGDVVDLSAAFPAGRPQELVTMRIGDAVAFVELALTEPEKQHGLMFRPRMSADDGMLFAYRSESPRAFWMSNTLIPLDIAFFRADGTFVNVNETPMFPDPRKPPANYETSASDGPAQYVLEMNLGWFKRKGLVDAAGKGKPGLRAEIPAEAR